MRVCSGGVVVFRHCAPWPDTWNSINLVCTCTHRQYYLERKHLSDVWHGRHCKVQMTCLPIEMELSGAPHKTRCFQCISQEKHLLLRSLDIHRGHTSSHWRRQHWHWSDSTFQSSSTLYSGRRPGTRITPETTVSLDTRRTVAFIYFFYLCLLGHRELSNREPWHRPSDVVEADSSTVWGSKEWLPG